MTDRQKAWRIKNPDKVREHNQRARAKLLAKDPEYFVRYAAEHKTEVSKRSKAWYATHKQESSYRLRVKHGPVKNEYCRARYQKRIGASRLEGRIRRSKRRALIYKSASERLPTAEIAAVFEVFGSVCSYCLVAKATELDHFTPLAKRGPHNITNIVASCRACNRSKGADLIFDWLPRFCRNGVL